MIDEKIEIHQRWNSESRKFEDIKCQNLDAVISKAEADGQYLMLKTVLNFIDTLDDSLSPTGVKCAIVETLGRNRI